MTSLGTGIAFLGAILAVGLACAGSGRGVGLAGEAGAGVIAEDPSKFAQCLILEIILTSKWIHESEKGHARSLLWTNQL